MERSTRFELISKLGEGGMGVVYEARDRERNMRVALKTLRRLDASSLYQFKREFRALSEVIHPNIVALYELVSEGDDWFLSMELVEGSDFISYVRGGGIAAPLPNTPMALGAPAELTLDTRVVHPASQRASTGNIPPITVAPGELVELREIVDLERLLDASAQLAQALYTLHSQGIVHRDLKPSNVRVTVEGRVVLMDFGIVDEIVGDGKGRGERDDGDDDQEDGDGAVSSVGTPMYMAPEQATGAPPKAAADWYAFGVLFYQALAGRLPFRGPTDKILSMKEEIDPPAPSTFTSGIPKELEALCMELLSRDPQKRPQGYDVLTRLGVGAERISRIMSEVTFIGPTEFVGRTRHIEELRDAFDEALAGKAVCVFTEGLSGMGKTTLLRRFVYELGATQAAKEPPLVLSGRCHERESLSYKAFDGIIDRLSRELIEQPAEQVNPLLPDDIDLLTRLFPVLRRIPGVQVARPMAGRNLAELRTRAIEALRVLLDRIGQWRPVVMRIEDLQWADSDSLELLVELLRPPAPRRLLILNSIRTDMLPERLGAFQSVNALVDALGASASCHRIEVGPFNRIEQELLVAKLAGDHNLPRDLDDEFWGEAEGNPLLLTELARFAADAPEFLRGSSRRPKLDDVIARRVARLSDNPRALLEAIAIAGVPTPLRLLADAIEMSADDRERASATLRVAKLGRVALPGREPWLNVQHDKIRETVLSGMPGERQRFLHLRLARVLERWDGASVSSLALHWQAAGDPEQAAKFLLAAAHSAAEKLAFERAAKLYREVYKFVSDGEPREQIRVLEPLGDTLALAGRYGEAAEIYAQGAALAKGDDGIELDRRSADNLLRAGRIEDGLDKLSLVMKQLGAPLSRGRARTMISLLTRRTSLTLRGLKYTPRAENEVAVRDLRRIDTLYTASSALGMVAPLQGSAVQTQHIKQALRTGEERRLCRALAVEVSYLGAMGAKHSRRADELGRDVLLRARKLDDPFLIGLAQMGSAVVGFFAGRMRAAAQELTESLDTLSGVIGSEWERMTCQYLLSLALINTGEWADARRVVTRSVDQAERRNDVFASSLFKAEPMSWCCLMIDRPDEAHRHLDEVLQSWPEKPFYLVHYQVTLARGLVHLYRGEGAQAGRVLDEAASQLGNILVNHMPLMMSEFLSCRGRAALMEGDLSTARKTVKRIAKLDAPVAPALAALLEAPIKRRDSDQQGAERQVSIALDAFGELDAPHMVAACQYRLGQLLGGQQGAELEASGLRWFEEHGVLAPLRMIAALTWQ